MKPKRILIVDSDLLDMANISQILLHGGYVTCHATDQGIALREVLELPPDLIICKLNVKRRAAQQFVQRVRQFPHLRDTPFLFVTESRRQTEAAPEILGPRQQLTKPFSPEQLLIAVRDHLSVKPAAQAHHTKSHEPKSKIMQSPTGSRARGNIL